MSDSQFLKVLDKAEQQMKQMKLHGDAARWFYDVGNLPVAYDRALQMEEAAERAVLLTRALPAYTGNPHTKEDVNLIKSICVPIQIGYTAEGWFSIRIPSLLPKKAHGSAEYIRSLLYPALQDFFMDKLPVHYSGCVLIYRHVYDRERPSRRKRDHDNIEVNMVSDTVALYVMPDDGPDVCSHYYCSAEGSTDRTEVYVVPQEEFSTWLEKAKTMPEKGVKLYETKLSEA